MAENTRPSLQTANTVALERKYADQVPVMSRAVTLRAYEASASPRDAIRAKCAECVGYEETLTRVRECTAYRCPLWSYRPYQDLGEKEGDAL